jgi:aminoglycoside phosphotransferase (APT) family kinase protein
MDVDAALAALRRDPHAPAATIDLVARALPWLADAPAATAVIHGDLHFHNLCIAADGEITGVFDVGDAGRDRAETDFHYAHSLGPRFVAIATRAYGRPLDDAAIRRAHLRTALTHILWNGPGTPRHPTILAWIAATFDSLVG